MLAFAQLDDDDVALGFALFFFSAKCSWVATGGQEPHEQIKSCASNRSQDLGRPPGLCCGLFSGLPRLCPGINRIGRGVNFVIFPFLFLFFTIDLGLAISRSRVRILFRRQLQEQFWRYDNIILHNLWQATFQGRTQAQLTPLGS